MPSKPRQIKMPMNMKDIIMHMNRNNLLGFTVILLYPVHIHLGSSAGVLLLRPMVQ